MADFVQLWVYLSSTPLFGLTATLATYVVAQLPTSASARAPWANPVLWSVVAIGVFLVATRTPYPTYFAGAQFIHVLLGRRSSRSPGRCGCAAARCAGAASRWRSPPWSAAPPPRAARWSLATLARPAAGRRPLARAEVGDGPGGDGHRRTHRRRAGPGGGVRCAHRDGRRAVGEVLFNCLGIASYAVRGFALGTASHGIGAARAIQVDEDAGAYAGIALGLQVLLASMLMPLVFGWLA